MRICTVVPSHDHHRAIAGIVAALRREDLPVYIVDDGSGAETAAALAALDEAQALAQHLGPTERVAGPRIGLGPYIGGFHHVDPSGASPRDGKPLSFADLAAERTTFIDAYGRFLFDAPPARGRAPATSAPWIGAGATLYTLEFPAGRKRYFVFASAAPRGEIERWAAAKGLRFVDAAPLGAPSREPTLRN